MATTTIASLEGLADAIHVNRGDSKFVHLLGEVDDMAAQIPPELRPAIGYALLVTGKFLSEPDGMNKLGLLAAALLATTKGTPQ